MIDRHLFYGFALLTTDYYVLCIGQENVKKYQSKNQYDSNYWRTCLSINGRESGEGGGYHETRADGENIIIQK